MVVIATLIILFTLFAFNPLLGSGNPILVFAFLLLGLSVMGLTFGPMGALLPDCPDRSALHRSIVLLQRSVDSGASVRRIWRPGCRLTTG